MFPNESCCVFSVASSYSILVSLRYVFSTYLHCIPIPGINNISLSTRNNLFINVNINNVHLISLFCIAKTRLSDVQS